MNEVFGGPPNTAGRRPALPCPTESFRFSPKTEVAARERKERKARRMNDENESHKNGGCENLQIPFSLCPLRSFAAIQFRSSGLEQVSLNGFARDCHGTAVKNKKKWRELPLDFALSSMTANHYSTPWLGASSRAKAVGFSVVHK